MPSNLVALKLLVWKNWLYYIRYPLRTAFQLLIPSLFGIIVIILVRNNFESTEYPEAVYDPFCVSPTLQDECDVNQLVSEFKSKYLVYAPKTAQTDQLMDKFNVYFKDVIGYYSSDNLEAHFAQLEANQTLAGIEFDDSFKQKSTLPSNVIIKIRFPAELSTDPSQNWKTDKQFSSRSELVVEGNRTGDSPDYFKEGFLTLQQVLVTSFMNISSSDFPKVNLRRYPHAEGVADPFLSYIRFFLPLLIMFIFIFPCLDLVRAIVSEKETQMKGFMLLMGIKKWHLWFSWFIKGFMFFFLLIVLLMIITKVSWSTSPVFKYLDISVNFVFLLLYICSLTTYCFFLSTLFIKASTAKAVCTVLFPLSFLPYFTSFAMKELGLLLKFLMCLVPNATMCFGLKQIWRFELSQDGIDWNNLWEHNRYTDELTFGLVLIMLIVDTIIYLILALYVEAVFPGPYGTPRPWYLYRTKGSKVGPTQEVRTSMSPRRYEKVTANLEVGIDAKNLSKKFADFQAVQNFNLKMYKHEITVLLGHSGAGKSTVVNLLTGLVPPTSGTALINGHDITKSKAKARRNLGLCPQLNVLFDHLTAREHLHFFAILRGHPRLEVYKNTERFIDALDFQDKGDNNAAKLSGGMKRKLCVAIALCGNSKIVLINEPTVGMDPVAQRFLWDVLKSEKRGRTILVCTQSMEEADVLGDRIAILAGGQIQCHGTSLFLKKKYDIGYHLTLEVTPNCDVSAINDLLEKHIDDVKISARSDTEIIFILPQADTEKLEHMFKNLEDNMEAFGVTSCGISRTSLEEVFLKVGTEFERRVSLAPGRRNSEKIMKGRADMITNLDRITLESGATLIRNQWKAMFMKRIFGGDWVIVVCKILIPWLFLIVTIPGKSVRMNLPALPLTLDRFVNPVTLLTANASEHIVDKYTEILDGAKVERVDNILTTIMALTSKKPRMVQMRYIAGAEFHDDTEITAWFNGGNLHSSALSFALALNAVFRNITDSSFHFEFINHPLPYTLTSKFAMLKDFHFTTAHTIIFASILSTTLMSYFYIYERICKFKHQQFVAGVNVLVFWGSHFVFELITFFIIIIGMLIVLCIKGFESYTKPEDLLRLLVIWFSFVCSATPNVYLCTFFCHSVADGMNKIFIAALIVGLGGGTLVCFLELNEMRHISVPIHWILIINPYYWFSLTMLQAEKVDEINSSCNEYFHSCSKQTNRTESNCREEVCHTASLCCDFDGNFYKLERPAIGVNLLLSMVLALITFIFICFLDAKCFKIICSKYCTAKEPLFYESEDDEDVDETNKILRKTDVTKLKKEYAVVVRDLTKCYKKIPAINGVSFWVKPYECFGLLATRGAGTSTAFRVMTGDEKMSSGEVWLNGLSIRTDERKIHKVIGYCPETDTLLRRLTIMQVLKIFALIRGVPSDDCLNVVKKLASSFGVAEHLDKKVKGLSSVNKRKLSTAVAIIGNPKIIFLDQPTEGMDPMSKRHIWNIIRNLRDSGKCIVLSTDSINECEAVCTKIAIMVNGKFKCIGSPKHLKRKFAEGRSLIIRTKKDTKELHLSIIQTFVKDKFPSAMLKEKYEEMLTYHIADASIAYSKMFEIMQEGKKELQGIEDYSIEQYSLEQVFLTLTKYQKYE